MSLERNRSAVMQYLESGHADASMMDEAVVFTDMATGQEYRGPDAVLQMLNYFYHVAFDATAETRSLTVDDDRAVWEGQFIGAHIGEFADIPPTGKKVSVPLTVIYDLADGRITQGRIYFTVPVLLQQLGAT